MLEKEMNVQQDGRFIIERAEDGRWILLPCGPAAAGMQTARNAVLFSEYAEKWLETVRCRVKESTYMKYWNMLYSYIIPELGDLKWDDLDREKIECFCGRLLSSGGKKKEGLSAKTVSDIMSAVRCIFRFAADHGARGSFNISTVTVKKEQKEMKVLTRKEQDRLYQYLRSDQSPRNLGILICLLTGLRLGEVCALKWEDISFTEQTIFVHQTMQRIQTKDDPRRKTKIIVTPPKSASSVRRIPIPRELVKILLSCRKGKSSYILTGRPDTRVEPRTMERHLDRVLRRLGIGHINFHALRHTFATRCVEIHFDVKSLSEILGHSDITITLNRYVHPTMEMKRSNMQRLSALMAAG